MRYNQFFHKEDGVVKLNYLGREVARYIASGRPPEYIANKLKGFGVTEPMVKKVMKEPLMLEQVHTLQDKLDDQVMEAQRRLILMADRALDVVEEVLTSPTNRDNSTKIKRDTAIDIIRQSGISAEKSKETQPITINLIKDDSIARDDSKA